MQFFRRLVTKIDDGTIVAIAFVTMMFVLGFAYGNLFGLEYEFNFREWQTLASTIIAIGLGMLAFRGVWSTQRVNVMIKEEERINSILPGLRQVMEILVSLQRPLMNLQSQAYYKSEIFIDSAFRLGAD